MDDTLPPGLLLSTAYRAGPAPEPAPGPLPEPDLLSDQADCGQSGRTVLTSPVFFFRISWIASFFQRASRAENRPKNLEK